jgi:acetyl esterase
MAVLVRITNALRLDTLKGLTPAVARARTARSLRLLAGRRHPDVTVDERSFAGPGGPLTLRVYTPKDIARPAPALLYLHGGGFVIGSLDTHDAPCSLFAALGRCVVLALDYRLAPEHKFPAAVDDCLAAFRWLADNAAELGLDPRRLAVGGDSAGGNLAAVVSQTAVREAWPVWPAFQLLIYPALDMRRQHASHRELSSGYILTSDSLDFYLGHYLRTPEDVTDLRVSPLLAPDLSRLPPAYIATAGFDPLRDEGDEYAERLRRDGVPAELARHAGLVHGFVNLGDGVQAAAAALADAGRALREALHP